MVEVDESDDASERTLTVGPELARRLGVTEGDAVLLTTAGGSRVASAASVTPTEGVETVRVVAEDANRIGLSDGEWVVLERREPATATEITVAPLAALSVRGGREAVIEALSGQPVVRGGTVDVSLLGGTLEVPFRVLGTDPQGVVVAGSETSVTVESGPAGAVADDYGPVPPTAVGGYETTVERSRSALVQPLTDPDAYAFGGASAAAGVLVTGQAGVGKSHHIRHAAWLADAELVRVDATRLAGSGSGATDYLDRMQARAEGQPRALVHVEGLDALAEDRDRAAATVERFAGWLDRLRRRPGVVVAGESDDPAALANALTRGDRLARRIEVPQPEPDDRAAVFATLSRGLRLGPGITPAEVGDRALGYVAADLVALRARMIEAALDRAGNDAGETPVVTAGDLETALADTTPSSSAAATVDVPDVSFDDVGGLTDAKRELVRAVEWPLRYPDALARLGIEAPGGVLLHGPPGTGKTLLARAVASGTDANFLAVDGPELFDRFVGESERAVREVFARASESAPAIVFFDEVDALGATRGEEGGAAPERVVSQLLTELDGLERREGVTVIGATNRPDRIDPALLRPGRFDRTVEVGLPGATAREEILRIHARDRPLTDVDLGEVAAQTEGFSGSDLAALLREASLAALEAELGEGRTPDDVPDLVVRPSHLETALGRVSASAAIAPTEPD